MASVMCGEKCLALCLQRDSLIPKKRMVSAPPWSTEENLPASHSFPQSHFTVA